MGGCVNFLVTMYFLYSCRYFFYFSVNSVCPKKKNRLSLCCSSSSADKIFSTFGEVEVALVGTIQNTAVEVWMAMWHLVSHLATLHILDILNDVVNTVIIAFVPECAQVCVLVLVDVSTGFHVRLHFGLLQAWASGCCSRASSKRRNPRTIRNC